MHLRREAVLAPHCYGRRRRPTDAASPAAADTADATDAAADAVADTTGTDAGAVALR